MGERRASLAERITEAMDRKDYADQLMLKFTQLEVLIAYISKSSLWTPLTTHTAGV